jgi:arylsulfatase A-like enzyme
MTSSYALEYGGFERLSPKRTTTAELLSDAGYETAGFHSNLYLSADFGYNRGFDRFFDSKSDPVAFAKIRQEVKTRLDSDKLIYRLLQRAFNATEKHTGIELGSAYVGAEEITNHALEWARSMGKGPRFLWVHYMDVHHPYVPPKKYQRIFCDDPVPDGDAVRLRRKMLASPDEITDDELNTLVDLYDAEIAYVDAEVDRLVTSLREEWGDNPVFAFTSDHGEEFLDHGRFSHSATFYDEVIHVPLFIDDGEPGSVHDDLVGLMDLSPTLATYGDAEHPESFRGADLSRVESDDWTRSEVISEWSNPENGEQRFSVRRDEWKYVREEDGTERLYNLRTDPDETENAIHDSPEKLEVLRDILRDHRKLLDESVDDLGEVSMDEEVKQRLRNLGYQE